LERMAQLAGIQDAIAAVDAARVVGVVRRLEQ
jgi:hypothetical protein